MKQSKYNFFFEVDNDCFIAFNALKDGLALVKKETVEKINALTPGDSPDIKKNLFEKLVNGGFLCEDDYDEYDTLVIRRNMQQYSSQGLGLTIAPTLVCDLSCKYCFENPDPMVMNDRVIEELIKFVKKYMAGGIRNLDITWFGGEPLLALEVIERLSDKFISLCEENKIGCSAYIITNGTHFTKETAEKLKKLKVRGAQITIDGEKDSHDQRRPYKNGKGSFETIIKNVREAAGVIPIAIRVNVDNTNIDKTYAFFDSLKKEEWFNKWYGKMISVHYGYVKKYTKSCRCTKEETLKPGDFWRKQLELFQYLKKNGYGFNHYPTLLSGCGATSINSYVVDPEGKLYKCWNHVGDAENVVGSIFEPVELKPRYISYLVESFERDSECKECRFLPICMGGCVDVRIKAKRGELESKDCTGWKFYLEDALREYYLTKMQEDQNSCRFV